MKPHKVHVLHIFTYGHNSSLVMLFPVAVSYALPVVICQLCNFVNVYMKSLHEYGGK